MNRVLTLAEVEEAFANNRTRGDYLPVIDSFAKSGEVAMDFSEAFPGKVAASLRNSVNLNITKNQAGNAWPTLKTVLSGKKGSEHVVLINMDAYHAAKEASDEDEQ